MRLPVSTNPSEITVSREKREVSIRWQDGHESVYGFDLLRRECPCALCNDQRGKQTAAAAGLVVMTGPVLKAGDVQVSEARQVGRYAINFVWSDGHDTGIYSYTFLREVCPCPTCRGNR